MVRGKMATRSVRQVLLAVLFMATMMTILSSNRHVSANDAASEQASESITAQPGITIPASTKEDIVDDVSANQENKLTEQKENDEIKPTERDAGETIPPLLIKLSEEGEGAHEDAHKIHAVRQHHAKIIVDEQGHITLQDEEGIASGVGRRSSLRHPRRNAHPAKAALVLIVLMCMLVAGQIGIVQWKTKSPKSYTRVSLVGLWLFPFAWNLYLFHWRFTLIWFIFTLLMAHITMLATAKPLHPKASQVVYRRLDLLYKLTSFTSSVGFGLIMTEFLGFRMLLHLPVLWIAPSGITLSFYGLLFGILIRDFAEVAAGQMCNTIGVHKYETPPLNLCALCGDELRPSLIRRNEVEGAIAPKVFTLDCAHEFHANCIKGWTIVGKRDTCPFCNEKVNLGSVAGTNAWNKQSIMMAQLLDSLRYMLVWNPLIMLSVRFVIWMLGLNEAHPEVGATLAPTMTMPGLSG